MLKLLMIADDFTGAMDTGVQFAARGASTRVVSDVRYDFSALPDEVEVMVINSATRHVSAKEAYDTVFDIVRRACEHGVSYIYKKTDSALRGNNGAEIAAAVDASGLKRAAFAPSFPKTDRLTIGGIHYISGVPVAESVFGTDPFNPVRLSALTDVLGEQTDMPVILHPIEDGADCSADGIHVYDAKTNEDLRVIGEKTIAAGFKVFAGCAGLASELAGVIGIDGEPPEFPAFTPRFAVLCGSVNPITVEQLDTAEAAGFPRVRLSAEQKLTSGWIEKSEPLLAEWLSCFKEKKVLLLDVNELPGDDSMLALTKKLGLTAEQVPVEITKSLGSLMKKLLDMGLDATLLFTGGDTILATFNALGVKELTPLREFSTGVVLTSFEYGGKKFYALSKSGGFGYPELFKDIALRTGAMA